MRLGVNGRFYGAPIWGVQRFAREVCRHLPREVPTTLFLPAGSAVARGLPGRTVRRGLLPGHAWEQLELPRLAHRAGCDVVLHLGGTGPLRGGPHVVALHDVFPLTHPEWYGRGFRIWFRAVVGRAVSRAAAIVAPTRWAAGEITRVLGVPRDRIHVTGQGVAPFRGPAEPAAVRSVLKRFDLPDRYMLALAGGDPRKNVAFLHRFLARWEAAGGEVPVLAVVGAHRARVHGRGAGAPRTHRGSAGATIPGRIRYLGYVDDAELHALYTGAGVFCFPSLGEGFGRPPLEAMACGTPAVVAPYGCAAEVLGDAALIVPLEPDAWIEAVASVLDDGAARHTLVAGGLRRAQGFRWEDASAAVLRACEAAIGASAPDPVGPSEQREAS